VTFLPSVRLSPSFARQDDRNERRSTPGQTATGLSQDELPSGTTTAKDVFLHVPQTYGNGRRNNTLFLLYPLLVVDPPTIKISYVLNLYLTSISSSTHVNAAAPI